jgi:adenylosuccinate synthase
VPLLADTSVLVDEAIRADQKVLLEGEQCTLLDLDHGASP